MNGERQRIDVWLFRARLTKTRAEAARLIGEGGVRLLREGRSARLEKTSAEVAPGDVVVFPIQGDVRSVRIVGLGKRRGPPAEARLLYLDQ